MAKTITKTQIAAQAPAIGFKPEEAESSETTIAMASMVESGGKYVLHVQIPVNFDALRVKEASKGEPAPASAYSFFAARVDNPKGVRVQGNVFIPLRLLHDATIVAAKQRWKESRAKAQEERAQVVAKERVKLG